MAKRSSLLIAAAAAILAVTIPSTASATLATCPTNVTCPLNTVITGTGKNVVLNTQFGQDFGCVGLNLKATITKNSGGVVTGEGASEEPSQVTCYVNEETSKPIKFTTVKLTMIEAKEATGPAGTVRNGTVSFIAKVKLPSEAVCEFTGTNVPGHFVSGADPAVLTSTDPAKDIPSTGGCGKAQLFGSFELEKTSNPAEKVVLD